ncbi:polysaccharide deacetylase family protein [bacterium]|nr:polysaccharide deacetylase family protein [bacterium]
MDKVICDIRLKLLRQAARKVLPDGYWENHLGDCHLTFDDGPFPETTPYLAELLFEKSVGATFFFTGENARKYPELVRTVVEAGHQVGNHSYSHLFCYAESQEAFRRSLELTNNYIEEASGKRPVVYRPPFGIIDKSRALTVEAMGMKLVYWGALAEDWQALGEVEVVRRIDKQLEPGTIIVLHETEKNRSQCLNATGMVIDRVREQGFEFDAIAHKAHD